MLKGFLNFLLLLGYAVTLMPLAESNIRPSVSYKWKTYSSSSGTGRRRFASTDALRLTEICSNSDTPIARVQRDSYRKGSGRRIKHYDSSCSCRAKVDDVYTDFSGNSGCEQLANPLCRRWVQDKCVECAYRSYMTPGGICQEIDPNCKGFSPKVGCTSCYQGYQLSNGKCVIILNYNGYNDQYCASWDNGVCIKCSYRAYFDDQGICRTVDPNCRTFSYTKGCTSCYDGYSLFNGLCTVSQVSYNDPYCSTWKNGKCIACSRGSYFKKGVCTLIDPSCKTFNPAYGCTSCYPGYKEIKGKCVIPKVSNCRRSRRYCAKNLPVFLPHRKQRCHCNKY